MSRSLFQMSILAAATVHMALGEGTCVTGVTFSGFTDTILNGDYIGDGVTNGVESSYFKKDGAIYPHDYWVTYDSPKHDGAKQTSWSIYMRGPAGAGDVLVAWCVPGVDGCPEGVPSSNDGGKIWPSTVGSMKWNVTIDGKTTLNSGVSGSCCKWTTDKCDSCKCTDNHFESTCKSALSCAKDCCDWACGRFHPFDCCSETSIIRHCDHSNTSTKAIAAKPYEFTV